MATFPRRGGRSVGDASQLWRGPAIFTRLVNFCWSLFQWCLLLAVLAAVTAGSYLYFRLDDEIRQQVEQRLATHYQMLNVRVGGARFEKDRGIAVDDVAFLSKEGDGSPQPMLWIDELYLAGKMRIEELVSERLKIDEIIIRRANLRAVRSAKGDWNVHALLPFPELSKESPIVIIEDATVSFEDGLQAGSKAQVVQGIRLKLTPVKSQTLPSQARQFQVRGTASGLPAREAVVEGEVYGATGVFNLKFGIRGLEISKPLLTTLPGLSLPDLGHVEISGQADLDLQLQRLDGDAVPHWSATARVHHGRLAHPLLPIPLTDFACHARATQNRLVIERFEAICGAGRVAVALERAGWNAHAPLAMAARVVGFSLNEQTLGWLPESGQGIWQRFQPRGTIDGEIRLQYDGRRWRPQLVANCREISLTDNEKFPYRLEHTSGVVEYWPADRDQPDRLRLDLTGFGGDRPVRIEAELTHVIRTADVGATRNSSKEIDAANQRTHALGWVKISGEDIPLHEQLLAALPEPSESLVRSLQPQGTIDFRFQAEWREPTQSRADVKQEIRLKDFTLRPAVFPFPLRDVNGLLTEQSGRWKLESVQGCDASGSAIVRCHGDLHQELHLSAENIALDDTLKMALTPGAQQLWDELRPQGRIDFAARLVQDGSQRAPVITANVVSRGRSVSIFPATLGYRLEQIDGLVTFDGNRVELRNLSARHEQAGFSAASGTWASLNDGGWRLDLAGVSADRLSPRDLTVALPPTMRHNIERLQPGGTFWVTNSGLSIVKLPQSKRLKAEWDLNLVCRQASLRCGFPVQGLTGEVRLIGRDDGQQIYTAGELSLDSLVWRDVQFTRIQGPLWMDSVVCLLGEPATQKQGLPPRQITADAYGGSIAANAELRHNATPSFHLNMAVDGASLARFANERLGGPEDMTGSISGRLVLSGDASSTQSLRGAGEIHVVDANIYELPVLVAMLKVLRNRTPNTTAFNRCDMRFTIEGEDIQFQQLDLLGDAVSLYGKGNSGFDRRLDLMFYTLIEPANLPLPFWRTIAGQVSKQAWQLKVVGTWDKAEVQPQPLPGFNQMFEQLQAGAATMAPATAGRDGGTSLPR